MFVGERSLRMLRSEDILVQHNLDQEIEKDRRYWDSVAQLRGGSADKDLSFLMFVEATPPSTIGGPRGYSTMTFRAVVRQNEKH